MSEVAGILSRSLGPSFSEEMASLLRSLEDPWRWDFLCYFHHTSPEPRTVLAHSGGPVNAE